MIYHCYPHFDVLKRSIHEGFRALKCLLIRANDFSGYRVSLWITVLCLCGTKGSAC